MVYTHIYKSESTLSICVIKVYILEWGVFIFVLNKVKGKKPVTKFDRYVRQFTQVCWHAGYSLLHPPDIKYPKYFNEINGRLFLFCCMWFIAIYFIVCSVLSITKKKKKLFGAIANEIKYTKLLLLLPLGQS